MKIDFHWEWYKCERVMKCFLKVKLDMTTQKELLQIEYIGWIAEWPSET
jgi:hypothetical protein